MSEKTFRLVTRSDFDGLVCALLLQEIGIINGMKFVHPKDVQDGVVEISENDITTNLPFVPAVHLSFDHHLSEVSRLGGQIPSNCIINPDAPSAARVVYEYYGGKERFPNIPDDLMLAVDKADSGRFTMDEVLLPKDWVLLNFLTDPRTGLGRFREFRISNYDLMQKLIELCRTQPIARILEDPDMLERVDLYFSSETKAREQIMRCSRVEGTVVIFDPRDEEFIWPTNRFMIYALFPQCTISIHHMWGLKKKNTVFAVGKSIFDRSNPVNIGAVMLAYGGGGHAAAGTCQVDTDRDRLTLAELVFALNQAR